MLKNILSLNGVQQLGKKNQKAIIGGHFCSIHCLQECYDQFPNNQAGLSSCASDCQDQANQSAVGF